MARKRCRGKYQALIDGECAKNYIPMSRVMKKDEEAGGYFFSPQTMRFFKSRVVSGNAFIRKDGKVAYFITSEKPPHGSREFRVRQVNLKTWDIGTARDVEPKKTSKQAWAEVDRLVEGED
jgi:hypothetical protein